MQFADLYNHANGSPGPMIAVRALADHVGAHHKEVGEVNFWPVDLDTSISLGHILYEYDRSTAYGDEYKIANIRYERSLNRCWRRFVCCKELMHVFDAEDQRADSREKFIKLLDDLETAPLPGERTPIYESEFLAQWMAYIVLCPESVRAKYKPAWDNKDLTDYDVALVLRVPEGTVRNIMGPMYEVAHRTFLS